MYYTSADSNVLLNNVLGNASSGVVYVGTGVYSATVTVYNGTRLIIARGATGITASIDTGATATIEDQNAGFTRQYVSGSLISVINLSTGLVDMTYGNFTQYWWGGENRTDTLAYPEQTASYIVFQDGSLTKMKNGTTGQVDASSTDASQIINWAIGNLTSGLIFVRCGKYNEIKLSVGAGKNITLLGENVNGVIFKRVGGEWLDRMIKGTDTSTNAPRLHIENIQFNSTEFDGQVTIGDYFTEFEAYNLKGYGNSTLEVEGQTTAFIAIASLKTTIENSHIEDFGYGSYISNYDYVLVDGNYIKNCGTVGLGTVEVMNDNATVILTNNILIDCGWDDEGLVIDRGSGQPTVNITGLIQGNIVFNPTKPNFNGAIMAIQVSGVQICDNIVVDIGVSSTVGLISVTGSANYPSSDIVIKNNKITTGGIGISVKYCSDTRIVDNDIICKTNAILTGIYFVDVNSSATIQRIHDNDIQVISGGSTVSYGISIEGYASYVTYECWNNRINILSGTSRIGMQFYLPNTDSKAVLWDNFIDATTPVNVAEGIVQYRKNSGTATIANGEWITHGAAGTPTTITITPRAVTYGSPAVTFVVGVVDRNSTKFQVGCYWTNGTAITTDAIVIDYYCEYKP
jgi:hypothetical protein